MLRTFLKTNFIYSHPITKTIVYANVFIATCALALVYLTYRLFPIPVSFNNNSYLLFIFLSTYLQYNVQRGYMVNQNNWQSDRSQWLVKHKKPVMLSVILSLLIVLFLCNGLSWQSISIMVGAEVLSTLYYLPPFNIRKYGYIKPFLISLIWVVSCVAVPLIEHGLVTQTALFYMLLQFCFIAALCMLFDIKDNADDFLNGVNTYANNFGITYSKIIITFLLTLQFLFAYLLLPTINCILPTMLTVIATFLITLYTNEKRPSFFYYLIIDGLIVLQLLFFVFI